MIYENSKEVAFFLQDIDEGGAERAIIHLANNLAFRGYKIILIVGYGHSNFRREISPMVNFKEFNSRSILLVLLKLIMVLKKEKPKVIMSALDLANYLLLCSAILIRYQGKIIFSQRATSKFNETSKTSFKKYIFALLEKLTFWRVNFVISNSYAAANEIISKKLISEALVKVIPNAVDFDCILKLSELPFKNNISIEKLKPFILCVGSVTKRKDLTTLIKSFILVKKANPEFKLIILGQGYDLKEFNLIKKMISDLALNDCVLMLGFDSNPYKWMKSSRVMVSSSLNEGFPNVLAEALVLNCKIVATDCPGDTAWLLGEGKWGRLVEVENYKNLAEGIIDAISDNSFINVSERAKDFSIEKNIDQHIKVFFN